MGALAGMDANMLELIQFPWSPFCLVQRRILEFAGVPFKITNVSSTDRSLVWKLTRKRYYGVPIIKQDSKVVFETDNDSQVIAKFLDYTLKLGLFPAEWEGVQSILWRDIENGVEEMCFKLNDVYWLENVPVADQLPFLRHKERKFGRGCMEEWRRDQKKMLAELTRRLLPYEEMLRGGPYLLGDVPRFIDFDLFGMLENFLYSGHYRLPAVHSRLIQWHHRLKKIKRPKLHREKLRS